MSYLIFARKYRPQTFDEVVGQEHVVRTLKQAISSDRLAQSFLFTGSRGVGKTSMARILAKALNCQKGPTDKPCGKCIPCTEIAQGNSLDTLEIDGASNRGIDEIRSLREQVKFKPAAGRFKVYIIDEVHMLTTEAFNALLKTLEEPPEHVKFIFATTEPAKVPITIVSRCQRYHFKPIPIRQIKEKLAEIAEAEKLKVGDDVLFLLARASEGSLRDGESLFDQLASFTKGKPTVEAALEAFGLTSEETLLQAVDELSDRNGSALLKRVDSLEQEGKDLSRFTEELSETLRHLLVLRTAKKPEELIDVSEHFLAELKKRAESFTSEDLLYMMQVLSKAPWEIRQSETPRLVLELALVHLAVREPLSKLSEILDELRKYAAPTGSPSGAPTGSPSGAPTGAPAGTIKPDPSQSYTTKSKLSPKPVSAVSSGTACEGGLSKGSYRSEIQSTGSGLEAARETPKPVFNADERLDSKTATAVLDNEPSAFEEDDSLASSAMSLSHAETFWPQVVERVKAAKISTGNYLAEGEPIETDGDLIIVGLEAEFSFHREALERKEHKDLISDICRQVFRRPVRLKFVVTKADAEETVQGAPPAVIPPIVEKAIHIFGGNVVRRKPKGS